MARSRAISLDKMRYGVVFGLLALICAAYSAILANWAARLPLAWCALSFALVSLAYLLRNPRLFMKTAGGSIPGVALAVQGPYLLLGSLGILLARREPAMTEVLPDLWLGPRLLPRDSAHLRQHPYAAVLDLAAELPELPELRSVPGYRSEPVLDASAPTPELLADLVSWLRERRTEGVVYVHCALGHGRSATVIAAFLVAEGLAANVEQAEAVIRAVRPGVRLNLEQRAAVRAFESTK